jgi:cysteine-rich repeat protein
MMRTLRTGAVALAGAALIAGAATTAYAQPTKASLACASAKLKTAGKDYAAKLKCYSKVAAKGLAVDPNCLTSADGKTTAAFAKIEAKGGCAVDANAFDQNGDTIGDGMVASILNQINLGRQISGSLIYRGVSGPIIGPNDESLALLLYPTQTASKCTAKKIGALGKFLAALFGCDSKAAKKNVPVDQACIDKAIDKLNTSFAKADAGVGCLTTGDAEDVGADAFRSYLRVVPSMPRFDGCGNGLVVTPAENCDDGNADNFDGCPSDCKIDACTPTSNPQPVTVKISDPGAAAVTIELDYPEGKVSLPGTGFEADVTNLTAGLLDSLDFDHAIRLVASDAAAFGQMEIATLNFVDCTVGGPPVVGDFSCTVKDASGPGGTPDLPATTCTVTIP